MSTAFEFQDGHVENPWDKRKGIPGGNRRWTRGDMNYAIQTYLKTRGLERTASMLRDVTGTTPPNNVPVYMFGRVIERIAREFASRPHRPQVLAERTEKFVSHRRKSPNGEIPRDYA